MAGSGDVAGDGGSCFRSTTGVDGVLSIPLTPSDDTIAGDMDSAGLATAIMLPPLDDITCKPCDHTKHNLYSEIIVKIIKVMSQFKV